MTHENYEQILNSTELNIKKYDLDKFIFSLLTKTKNDL